MSRDLQYEKELVHRLNTVMVNGVPAALHTPIEGVSVWHTFQQFLLDSDVKLFARTRSFALYQEEVQKLSRFRVRRTLSALVLLCLQLGGLLVLVVGRPKVLVFGVDKVSDTAFTSDFRMHGLYKFLRTERIRFLECLHTIPGKQLVSNFLKRMRFALYVEAFDVLWYIGRAISQPLYSAPHYDIGAIHGTDDEVAFIRFTVKKYLAIQPLIAFRIRALAFVLKYSAVRTAFLIDDVRHYQALTEACRIRGIPTYALQHGHYTKYHIGWLRSPDFGDLRLMCADVLLVWSEYWKNELVRLGSAYPEECLVVSGRDHGGQILFKNRDPHHRVLLVPHESESIKSNVSAFLKEAVLDPRTIAYLKLRPDMSRDEQLTSYGADLPPEVRVVDSLSDVPHPDVVAGVYSSFLYDMIERKIPILVIYGAMDFGEGIVQNRLGEWVKPGSVSESIEKMVHMTEEERDARARNLGSEANFADSLRSILRRVLLR